MHDGVIRKIAYELFKDRKHLESFEHELTLNEASLLNGAKSEEYVIANGKIIFLSKQFFEEKLTEYYLENIDFSVGEAGEIVILTALEIWRITLRGNYTTAGIFLNKCSSRIDILQSLILYLSQPYEASSLADQYIKYLLFLDVENISKFIHAIYQKYNGFVGDFSELKLRLVDDTNKCREFINYFYSNPIGNNVPIYNMALLSLQRLNPTEVVDILLKDIAKNNEILTPQAFWILSSIDENTFLTYKQNEVVEAIQIGITSSSETVENAALQAAINLIEKNKTLYLIILRYLNDNNIKALEILSERIICNKKLTEHDDFSFWMEKICKNANHSQHLKEMSMHILSLLIENDAMHDLIIVSLLTILKNEVDINTNDYFLVQLIEHQDLTSRLITLSLLDDDLSIASFSQKLSLALRAYPNRILFQTMMPQVKCNMAS